jgi:tRNA (guanosine-2'-O-)-methyltransferase
MNNYSSEDFIEYLSSFISENKLRRFEEVLEYRTRYLTVVLEDIYQPQNTSAVIRSCELLGLQDLHIIENENQYTLNPDVVVGSNKWIRLYKHKKNENNTLTCFERLRAKGYKIVATSPHKNDYTPENIPLDHKLAFVIGKEKAGLSDDAMNNADMYLNIPSYGFTESYNLSVSAAITTYTLLQRLRGSNYSWRLSREEKNEIKLQWMKKVVKRFDLHETEFCTNVSGKK